MRICLRDQGGQEGFVHSFVGFVGNAVRFMFNFFEPGDPGSRVVMISGHFKEELTAFVNLACKLFKIIKKLSSLGKRRTLNFSFKILPKPD